MVLEGFLTYFLRLPSFHLSCCQRSEGPKRLTEVYIPVMLFFFISIVMLLTHVRYASLPRRDGICLQFSFLAKSVSTSRSSVIRCGRVGACAHTARRRSFISLACHVRFGNGDEGSGGKVEFGEERGGAASRGIRLRRHRPERMSAMTGKSLEVALKSRTEEGEGQNGSAFLRQ